MDRPWLQVLIGVDRRMEHPAHSHGPMGTALPQIARHLTLIRSPEGSSRRYSRAANAVRHLEGTMTFIAQHPACTANRLMIFGFFRKSTQNSLVMRLTN